MLDLPMPPYSAASSIKPYTKIIMLFVSSTFEIAFYTVDDRPCGACG
jgi:hypothetical protein